MHPNTIKELPTGVAVLSTRVPVTSATVLASTAVAAAEEEFVMTRPTVSLRSPRGLEIDAIRPGTSVLDELLTAPQVASILQMRVSTIEEYARRGLLPSIKLGRHRQFVRAQVEEAILDLIEPPAAPRSGKR